MKKWISYVNAVELVQVKEPKCFYNGYILYINALHTMFIICRVILKRTLHLGVESFIFIFLNYIEVNSSWCSCS
ncbi:hypothetical protein LPICM17_680003 [Lactococcus piscium]|nr:hypothetical protein LPICM17_680003 [Lactococcus piscium]